MPSTIVVNCPDCDKEMKVPAELEGKKIRCKGCGETFVVKAPRKAAVKPAKKASEAVQAKAKAKAPAKPAKPAPSGHDDEAPNPYGVTEESLLPRCPHCAFELESEDAIICLHCGYNTQTRERLQPVLTVEHTPLDWILWLLPGILCILLIFACIGCIVFLFVWLNDIIEAHKDDWWAFAPRSFQLWGTIFNLFIMFFAGRFAIKRLIFNPRPPEKIKRK